jgi:hypothetical protein
MTEPQSLRSALLRLHGVLLQAQRVEAERFDGRMTASQTLQAAADDLRFDWLKPLSGLITGLDTARSAGDAALLAAGVDRVTAVLDPPDPESSFGARYLRALQDHPDAVLAHRDVAAALARVRGGAEPV